MTQKHERSIINLKSSEKLQRFLEKNSNYKYKEFEIEPTEKNDGFYIARIQKM